MRRIAFGSRIIASGIAQTGYAIADILRSIPFVSQGQRDMTESEAQEKIILLCPFDEIECSAPYSNPTASRPLKVDFAEVKIGDLDDDVAALHHDAFLLAKDMTEAGRKVLYVE